MLLTLAGCNAGLTPSAPAESASARNAGAAAGSRDLIYVPDGTYDLVNVMTYPKMHRTFRIGETFELGQMCTDGSHLWMPGGYANEIPEYEAGGREPIAVLQDPGYTPDGCAYDPTTGDLAVTNFFYKTGTAGNVLIYPKASGTPQVFTCNLFYYFYATYDNAGTLYLDGVDQNGNIGFCYLPKGQSTLFSFYVGETFEVPGGMLWDGKDVTVSDPQEKTIYRFIVKHGAAQKLKSTVMTGIGDCGLYWVDGNALICPNGSEGAIEYYRYPQGGAPVKTYTAIAKPAQAIVVSKGH